jgi:tRNA(fMet)-specific endonuclease VapC
MIYHLDSNVVRDLMDEHSRVKARVAQVSAPDTVAVCAIVRGEVLFGIERLAPGARRDRLLATAAAVFRSIGEAPIPFAAGEGYSRVKRERQRLGLPLDENDLWIAATALALGATLVTRDADSTARPGWQSRTGPPERHTSSSSSATHGRRQPTASAPSRCWDRLDTGLPRARPSRRDPGERDRARHEEERRRRRFRHGGQENATRAIGEAGG